MCGLCSRLLIDSFFCYSPFPCHHRLSHQTTLPSASTFAIPLLVFTSGFPFIFCCLTVWAVDVSCQQHLSSPIPFDACLTSILNKGTARHAFRSPAFQLNPSLFLNRSLLRLLIVCSSTYHPSHPHRCLFILHCTLFATLHSFSPHRYERSLSAPNKDRRRTEHARQQNFKHIHLYYQTPLNRTATSLFLGYEHVSRKQNTTGSNCISPEAGPLLPSSISTSNAN